MIQIEDTKEIVGDQVHDKSAELDTEKNEKEDETEFERYERDYVSGTGNSGGGGSGGEESDQKPIGDDEAGSRNLSNGGNICPDMAKFMDSHSVHTIVGYTEKERRIDNPKNFNGGDGGGTSTAQQGDKKVIISRASDQDDVE